MEEFINPPDVLAEELTVIKQQFVKVLTGMYHSRIDYPIQNNDEPEEEPADQEAQ